MSANRPMKDKVNPGIDEGGKVYVVFKHLWKERSVTMISLLVLTAAVRTRLEAEEMPYLGGMCDLKNHAENLKNRN